MSCSGLVFSPGFNPFFFEIVVMLTFCCSILLCLAVLVGAWIPLALAHVSVPSTKDEIRSNLCLHDSGFQSQAKYVVVWFVEQCKLQAVYFSS